MDLDFLQEFFNQGGMDGGNIEAISWINDQIKEKRRIVQVGIGLAVNLMGHEKECQ